MVDSGGFKLGCQSIVWGPRAIRRELPGVLCEIAQCGYRGAEIGARHLDLSENDKIHRLLSENSLELVGLHTGSDCLGEEEARSGFPRAREILDAVVELGGCHIIISGPPTEKEMGNLDELGTIADKKGVKICYHNHYREIEDHCRILRGICDNTDPGLVGLALDLGWVHRAGGKVLGVIDEFMDRISLFHFKDVVGILPEERENLVGGLDGAVEIGAGDLPWVSIVDTIRDNSYCGWIVVEQDRTRKTPAASSCQSRRYLREVCGI